MSRLIVNMDDRISTEKYPEVVFFAMMFTFFSAMFTGFIGLSAIVGGFIAGVPFPGVNLKRSPSFREGAGYLRTIIPGNP